MPLLRLIPKTWGNGWSPELLPNYELRNRECLQTPKARRHLRQPCERWHLCPCVRVTEMEPHIGGARSLYPSTIPGEAEPSFHSLLNTSTIKSPIMTPPVWVTKSSPIPNQALCLGHQLSEHLRAFNCTIPSLGHSMELRRWFP